MLNEHEPILYSVKVNGNVLLDRVELGVAEAFVASMSPTTQNATRIEAVNSEGLSVLLG